MAKTNDIKENFSALLRDSLRSRFGRIPSAAVFAREFNLRAYDTSPISQESARRWLRGVSLPEEARLRVLVNWLNLNFNDALKPGRVHGYKPTPDAVLGAPPSASVVAPGRAQAFTGQASQDQPVRFVPNGSALTEKDAALLSAIFNLGEEQRMAILGLIGTAAAAAIGTPALASTQTAAPAAESHASAAMPGMESRPSLRNHR